MSDPLTNPLTDPFVDSLDEDPTRPHGDPQAMPASDPIDASAELAAGSDVAPDAGHDIGTGTGSGPDVAGKRARRTDAPLDAFRALVATPVGDTSAPSPASAEAADVRLTSVTCPRCKSLQEVAANRRLPTDFCRSCDYPLFWVAAAIELDSGGSTKATGRLPGTGGVRTVASLICRHCAEPNEIDATVCQRCGLSLTETPLPVPPPVPTQVVLPDVAPLPPKRTPMWVWILLALLTAVALGLIIWSAVG